MLPGFNRLDFLLVVAADSASNINQLSSSPPPKLVPFAREQLRVSIGQPAWPVGRPNVAHLKRRAGATRFMNPPARRRRDSFGFGALIGAQCSGCRLACAGSLIGVSREPSSSGRARLSRFSCVQWSKTTPGQTSSLTFCAQAAR